MKKQRKKYEEIEKRLMNITDRMKEALRGTNDEVD